MGGEGTKGGNLHDGKDDVGFVFDRGEGDWSDHDDHKVESLRSFSLLLGPKEGPILPNLPMWTVHSLVLGCVGELSQPDFSRIFVSDALDHF